MNVQFSERVTRAVKDLIAWGYVEQLPDGSVKLTPKGHRVKNKPIPELRESVRRRAVPHVA